MASSSKNFPEISSVLFTIKKHLQEDKERHDKLNLLINSFQQADNEKTQLICALQEKPYLSKVEQECVNLLRMQCMKDWQNTSKCSELSTLVCQQIQEKEEILIEFNEVGYGMDKDCDEQPNNFAKTAEDFFFHGDVLLVF